MATFESALSSYLRSTRHSSKIGRQHTPKAHDRIEFASDTDGASKDRQSLRAHLIVKTYRRTRAPQNPEGLGTAKLVIEPPAVKLITKLESRLHDMNQADLSVPISPSDIKLKMPQCCGPLQQFTLHLTTRHEPEQCYLHFVARRSTDLSLVYSDAIKIESVIGARYAA